jgi:uncharacterized caspase-like protein
MKPYFCLTALLMGILLLSNPLQSQILKAKSPAKPYNLKKSDFEKKKSGNDMDNFQPSSSLPQIWAVVIGISEYTDPGIKALKYADKDAKAFYDFLRSSGGGSVPEDHIALLTNSQATRSNIIGTLQEKFRRAFEEDLVIFYIAGHGQPDPVGEEVFFLSHDASSANLGGTAVSQLDIEKEFRRTRARKRIWIADACHSGGVGLQVRAEQAALTNKLLTAIGNSTSTLAMFSASSSSEYSFEDAKWGGGHGVFTYYLLRGLKGEADADKNKLISLRELSEYTYRQVADATRGNQHTELKGTFDNKLPLAAIK